MEMKAEWPARIEAAQAIHEYVIGGTAYPRIRYGDEEGGPFPEPCHDCGVLLGQYHVELVCGMERCPCGGGPVIGCDCAYDGDEAAEPSDPPLRDSPSLTVEELRGLVDRIRPEIEGYTLFLETKNGRFTVADDHLSGWRPNEVVALGAAWIHGDVPPWETEDPAEKLAQRLW
jgi:hypothetical protein